MNQQYLDDLNKYRKMIDQLVQSIINYKIYQKQLSNRPVQTRRITTLNNPKENKITLSDNQKKIKYNEIVKQVNELFWQLGYNDYNLKYKDNDIKKIIKNLSNNLENDIDNDLINSIFLSLFNKYHHLIPKITTKLRTQTNPHHNTYNKVKSHQPKTLTNNNNNSLDIYFNRTKYTINQKTFLNNDGTIPYKDDKGKLYKTNNIYDLITKKGINKVKKNNGDIINKTSKGFNC